MFLIWLGFIVLKMTTHITQTQNLKYIDGDKNNEKLMDYKGVPIPLSRKLMAQPGIEPRCPVYMADALTAELLTTPAEMSAGTMTDGSCA